MVEARLCSAFSGDRDFHKRRRGEVAEVIIDCRLLSTGDVGVDLKPFFTVLPGEGIRSD